ncbi:Alpha-mannosidase [Cocos nucifera]|uniref:Alpha-mannosidase n=1 Tax=Cocos nucifera TaxID=13894 RepID=A0A8K0IE11_COCNU|nr:Alpha-mannosidase [Cocos nucifera]
MARLAVAFLCILMAISACNGGYIRYNTSAGLVAGKLNVHLVAHSHDDVGWLKTIDQYYVGSNNSIQGACVMNVLDSVVDALLKDPNRKFIFAEQAFFQRWWREQNEQTREVMRKLVDSGQLEFVNGGWCMHDEATVHYIDMIDQTTLGHLTIKKQFNKVPRVGWQIDPFGHSAVQGYLLGAELGFDSVHFARIDYQDRQKRKVDKSLEVIWRGSKSFGSSSQIFANAFPVHYRPPEGFGFEVDDDIIPVQDDKLLYDYNVEQRVNDFIDAAITQANVTRTNHIMWTMGDDFQYQYAESWFRQMDKLIHYVNKDGRVHALYSTPSIYTDAKYAANESWPLKFDDYFPYADAANAYWTGYFTSRPAFKRYVRMLSGYYLAARQIEFLAGRTSSGPSTWSLGDALGIAQHHDAVTGTAKQHTTDDYEKRLAYGASEAEKVVNLALPCLTNANCASSAVNFSQCNLLNISYCPASEEELLEGKSLVVVAYNPLGWNRSDFIRIPVNDDLLVVRDSNGNNIDTQFVEVENVTSNMRNLYVKAYIGVPPKEAPKYWLVFQVSVPPLGWNSYFISRASGKGMSRNVYVSAGAALENDTIEVGPGPLKMSFSSTSGRLKRMVNYRTGVIRLYKDKEHAEIEYTVGPIPTDDGVGKEVITRLTANMVTNETFFTDSNGRDFLKRVRDHREDWNLQVTQPIAGNYYPAKGNYYMSINQLGSGAYWRRTCGQQIYSPLLLAFTHENEERWKSSHITKASTMEDGYGLPPNVALITLQDLDDGTVLLRLAHLYEAGEDVQNSAMVKVELKKVFAKKMIKELKETSISANQEKSEMKQMTWQVEGDDRSFPAPT